MPLANLVKVVDRAGPARYNRYNRMRAVTISASLEPGFALGDALEFLEQTSRAELPDSLRIDWKGESSNIGKRPASSRSRWVSPC